MTVRVDTPPPPLKVRVSWFFQNKLTYFDLFYHFIKGEIGPIFSHLLTVRAEGADPPSPPLTVSLTVKRPLFFLTTPLRILWKKQILAEPFLLFWKLHDHGHVHIQSFLLSKSKSWLSHFDCSEKVPPATLHWSGLCLQRHSPLSMRLSVIQSCNNIARQRELKLVVWKNITNAFYFATIGTGL